jgi:aspartyl-tRNA synthetase
LTIFLAWLAQFFFAFIFLLSGELEGIGPLVSSLKPEKKEQLAKLLDAKAGDLILFALGEQSSANRILGRLRLFIAQKMEVIDKVSLKLTFFFLQHMGH